MSKDRREFLAGTAAAFTTSLFTGRIKGANDRISLGFIGVGGRGFQNLRSAINEPNTQISAVCDAYEANLEIASTEAQRNGHKPKNIGDFREVLADKSIDAVVISTPDHWHALMTVEACKAGKDVYIEKPVCTYVDEAPKMIQAMQKYKRIVQGGTNSRSGGHMSAIREVIRSARLGQITSVNVNLVMKQSADGIGSAPDTAPPPGLNWNMWLGPAQQRPYNQNRFWTVSGPFASFRYFWDYAGGNETDNGIHIVDLLQMAFGETAPTSVTSYGTKTYLKDASEVPDTYLALYQYPEFLMEFEMRNGNGFTGGVNDSILVHGSNGTLGFGRPASYRIYPERESMRIGGARNWSPGAPTSTMYGGNTPTPAPGQGGATPAPGAAAAGRAQGAQQSRRGGRAFGNPVEPLKPSEEKIFEPTFTHMGNFLECMRTRQKPIADLEYCARSSVAVILGNVSCRARVRVDFDWKTWSSPQKEARPFMEYRYRAPWKLEV